MFAIDTAQYIEFADKMQKDLNAFDSLVNGLSDENQKRNLRQKILSMKETLDMLTRGLKSGKIDSEYSLAKCKVDLLNMKQDFEKAFHAFVPKSIER